MYKNHYFNLEPLDEQVQQWIICLKKKSIGWIPLYVPLMTSLQNMT